MLEELDVVALTDDLEDPPLPRGSVGTVVCVYSARDVEVEFVDRQGRTYGLVTLPIERLLRLNYNGPSAA